MADNSLEDIVFSQVDQELTEVIKDLKSGEAMITQEPKLSSIVEVAKKPIASPIALQHAELTGIITSITQPKHKGESTYMKILCPNINKTFDVICGLSFCPLRQGDTINALCTVAPDGKLHINKPPFVQPAIDKDSIIQCLMRALKQGYKQVYKFYTAILNSAGDNTAVIPFLTGLSQTWNDTRNSDILFTFANIEPEDVKNLLNWWYKERNLRRLYLFGLNKKEINACRLTCDEIYTKCVNNPYTVPAIPLDKCASILDQLNKKFTSEQIIRGSIVRLLWRNLHGNAWVGTPTRILAKNYPDTKNHVEVLKQEYEVKFELETAYLAFPYKVELWVTNYLVNRVKMDPIKYDTPLDTKIVLDAGKVVERVSAHTTFQLSEDQMRAVQGALDHSVSVISGSAGVGKCLLIGTKVLMFDGSIRPVEELKIGDQLMGPDSKPRNILSTCVGIGDTYEVIPAKGKSFICNSNHILTLKGLNPSIRYCSNGNNPYILIFTVEGIRRSKCFKTEQEAIKYMSDLQDDIFDIPLNEYMKRAAIQQKFSNLFHVGINFPEREVPFDPYIIGFWLGDGIHDRPGFAIGDIEIVNEIRRIIKDYGLKMMQIGVDKIMYNISSTGDNYGKNGANKFINTLRDLNLLHNKHIPDIYKINSRTVRLKVLAGLIDSDGYNTCNCIEITQKNVRLSKDIEYLAFSLGFMITRNECEKSCMHLGEKFTGIYQRMHITGKGLEEIPVILERKRCVERKRVKEATCSKFKVKHVGNGIYRGFELDGDGRFLLGDFLVTHNSTVVGQVMHNLELRGIPYAVGAFTGKAVSRIREVTKTKKPSTIHRLIANTRVNRLDKRSTKFEKEPETLEYQHIIIDEASMLTTELFYDFIQAYPNVKHITFVGDVNQLSPIGWGALFSEMLKSETIPTYRLTTNYRVYTADGERDGIILNANAIISHDPTYPFEFVSTGNFTVIEGPIERVYDIIRGCFAANVKAHQLVIVTPYNRSLDILNKTFQEIYNDGARSITDSRGIKWMIGDRVMLTENDQEIGVFNGESGTVRDITNKTILVDFGHSGCHEFLLEPLPQKNYFQQGTVGTYWKRGYKDEVFDGDEGSVIEERTVLRLTHAYALTVDKSQGSEWDFVVVFVPEFNTGSFLNRNRIYTAITRAKRACWAVVSDSDAFNETAVRAPPFRCENLAKRLSMHLPNMKPFKLPAPIPALEMNGDAAKIEEIPVDAFDTGIDCDDY